MGIARCTNGTDGSGNGNVFLTATVPLQPVQFNSKWTHLSSLQLADPDFGNPGK